MAQRGHRVELCVQGRARSDEVLRAFGLSPLPTLRLRVLPVANTPASTAYRARFAAWVLRTGGRGVALARSKRHAAWALRWFGSRFRLLLEAHEVDSVQRADAGEDPAPLHELERRVLARSWGVVANCEGTLRLLQRTHPRCPPAVVAHNGARPGVGSAGQGEHVGCVGSVRPYKDPRTVARAAASCRERVVWIGPDASDLEALQPLAGGRLRWEAPVPPARVPARLAEFRALLLPLSPGRFGAELTSPLKLWDALQSGVPLVAADTAAIRDAAGGAYVPYTPGDVASLVRALDAACHDTALRRRVLKHARRRARTWEQRAAEVEAFVDRVLS